MIVFLECINLPVLKSIYPSPPEITSIDGNKSLSETFSTTGPSLGTVVAAEIPPFPEIEIRTSRKKKSLINKNENKNIDIEVLTVMRKHVTWNRYEKFNRISMTVK